MAARDILKLLNNRRNRGEKVKSFQPGGRIEYVNDVAGLSPDIVQAFADYLNTPVEDRPGLGNEGIGSSYLYYQDPEEAYQAAVDSLTLQITGEGPEFYGTEDIADADLRGGATAQIILRDLGIEDYKDYVPPENAGVDAVIDTNKKNDGAGSGKSTTIVDLESNPPEVEYEVGKMGNIGSILKGASLIGDIGSLITAGDRQEKTVKAFEDAADVAGDPSVVDPSARNLAYLQARGDDSERASTLATLIQQGVNPAQAAQIIQKQKDAALTQLINSEQAYQQQVFTAKERGRQRRMQFDMMATQAGLPIDYWGQAGQIVSKAGDLALGLEGLYNPAPEVKTDKKAQGGTFKTGGAFSHETNPLTLVTKDGEIAKDTKGRTMELTGQEYVVPENKVDAIQSLPPDEALKAYNRMFNEFDKQA
mgnify:CR=1 FL=1